MGPARLRLSAILLLLGTSCASPQSELRIRAATSNGEVEGVGDARAQLTLGNVGLAIEGFRAVLRKDPQNVSAALGLAQAYDEMGRPDLSRKWFETALASAPDDANVLQAFAGSLSHQGKLAEAALVRREAETASTVTSAVTASAVTIADTQPLTGGSSVTVQLPPPRFAYRLPAAPALQPVGVSRAQQEPKQPHLERLSLAEVALITRSEPKWTGEVLTESSKSVTFRWVKVQPTARLLNAARQQGLAARTRAKLLRQGWKNIEIGDAPAVRTATLVLYPTNKRASAERLAKQFGFTRLRSFSGDGIVVLLGRDAAAMKVLRET